MLKKKRYQRLLPLKASKYSYRDLMTEKSFLKVQQRARGIGVDLVSIDYEGMELRFRTQSTTIKGKYYTEIIQLSSLSPEDIISGKNLAEVLRSAKIKIYSNDPAFLYWGTAYWSWRQGFGLYPERRFPRVRNPHHRMYVCFEAGTKVLTPMGLVPIETLREGDLVFTHNGVMQPIVSKSEHFVDEVSSFRVANKEFVSTPKHRMLASKHNSKTKARRNQPWDTTGWWRVEDLEKGDFMFRRKVILPELVEVDPNLAWLLGVYLADGTVQYKDVKKESSKYQEISRAFYAISIACESSKKDQYLAEFRRRGIPIHSVVDDTRESCFRVRITDKQCIEFCVAYGRYTDISLNLKKQLTPDCVGWNKESKKSVVAGFFFGDGTAVNGAGRSDKRTCYIRFYNTNYQILNQLYVLLCEDYLPNFQEIGYTSNSLPCNSTTMMYSITLTGVDAKNWAEANKEALSVKSKDFDSLKFTSTGERFSFDEVYPVTISSIELKNRRTKVYNIEVADDESYLIEGQVISHNSKHMYAVLMTFPFLAGHIGKYLRKYWTEKQQKEFQDQMDKVVKDIKLEDLIDA